jgi:hypothetical protein
MRHVAGDVMRRIAEGEHGSVTMAQLGPQAERPTVLVVARPTLRMHRWPAV